MVARIRSVHDMLKKRGEGKRQADRRDQLNSLGTIDADVVMLAIGRVPNSLGAPGSRRPASKRTRRRHRRRRLFAHQRRQRLRAGRCHRPGTVDAGGDPHEAMCFIETECKNNATKPDHRDDRGRGNISQPEEIGTVGLSEKRPASATATSRSIAQFRPMKATLSGACREDDHEADRRCGRRKVR